MTCLGEMATFLPGKKAKKKGITKKILRRSQPDKVGYNTKINDVKKQYPDHSIIMLLDLLTLRWALHLVGTIGKIY